LRDPIAVLRANLSPGSAVLRHAVRIAVLVAGSDLVLRLAGTPRGYWVPLTIMVVLRPDFATTFQRASMRVTGTVLGLLLATVLIHFVPGGEWWHIALVGVFFFGMRFAGPGNLALGAVALSALVVVLLSLVGVSPHSTVARRAVDTVVGGALAMVAVLLRPLWERDVLPQRMADLLRAYRDYTIAVSDPRFDPARLQQVRAASRLARSNAEASVDRARSEPVPGRGEVELGDAVLAHSHRYVHAVMTLDAARGGLSDGMAPAGRQRLPEFVERCARVLDACAASLGSGVAPNADPALRQDQLRLADLLDGAGTPGAETTAAVIDATDRMVNSLDTLIAELRRQARVAAAVSDR
jgi:uncharacterized membrane protein YccC